MIEDPDGGDEADHEMDPKPDNKAPYDVLVLRELLYFGMSPPQHRNPVSGTVQVSTNKLHGDICKAATRVLSEIVRRIELARDLEE